MQLLKYVLVSLLLLNSSVTLGVWNSSEIDKSNYSYVFRFETEMVCTATLLTRTIAITAAHCFSDFNITTNKKFRAIDASNQDVGFVHFKKIIFHPQYDMDELKDGTLPVEKSGFDIAMIILSENDQYVNQSTNAFLEKYSLPIVAPNLTANDDLLGLGLGSTNDTGDLADLGAAVLKTNSVTFTSASMLKFSGRANQSLCPGDSGGPIIKMHKGIPELLGNLSGKISLRIGSDSKNARTCEDDQYSYYVTNFFLHRDWIKSVISSYTIVVETIAETVL